MKLLLQALVDISNCKGSGSKEKQLQLLRENDSEEFRELLQIAFNPYRPLHIAKVEGAIFEDLKVHDCVFEDFKYIVEKLEGVKAINDRLRGIVTQFVCTADITKEQREILIQVFCKSLNIGIGIKTINKVYDKDFLPDVEPMLAESENEEVLKKWLKEYGYFYCEEKFDGCRLLIPIEKGVVRFFTREFRELDTACLPNLKKSIEALHLNNCFLDGEWTDLNRQTVSGRLNKILKGNKEIQDEDTIAHLFAINPLETFYNKRNGYSYETNRKILGSELFQNVEDDNPWRIVMAYKCDSLDRMRMYYNSVVKAGGEGLICKRPGHTYHMKRSSDWIKKKEENICDLRIITTFPGKGKRLGKIGGFICESEDGLLKVNVGGGFSDELIDKVTKSPENYKKKIVEIKYNIKSQDEKGNWSLFLPRLNGKEPFRIDKTIANKLKEIK